MKLRSAWSRAVAIGAGTALVAAALAAGGITLAHAGDEAVPEAPSAPPAPPAPVHAQVHERASRLPRVPLPSLAPLAPPEADDDGPRVRVDTVFVVAPGARLNLFNFSGNVALKTWGKNAVRLLVERSTQDRVAITREGTELKFESVSTNSIPRPMEFDLIVPPWLPVTLSGVNNDVTAEGLTGGLSVDTVHGDILARHLGGPILLHSVEGVVDLADAKGSIDVSSVNDAVRVEDVTGDVSAEGVNGDVHLVGIDSHDVRATTISGDVVYDSPMQDGGTYRFETHSGDIAVGMPDAPNATVSVATFSGDFASAFDIRPLRQDRADRGKRMRFTLGNGAAKVNLESFQGSIEILRKGQRELRMRMDDALRARREALKQWGEWNPARRMQWKLKAEKSERDAERAERAAEHAVDHVPADTSSDE